VHWSADGISHSCTSEYMASFEPASAVVRSRLSTPHTSSSLLDDGSADLVSGMVVLDVVPMAWVSGLVVLGVVSGVKDLLMKNWSTSFCNWN
jgi:hypothetical protein